MPKRFDLFHWLQDHQAREKNQALYGEMSEKRIEAAHAAYMAEIERKRRGESPDCGYETLALPRRHAMNRR
jgi:hypothetical protein